MGQVAGAMLEASAGLDHNPRKRTSQIMANTDPNAVRLPVEARALNKSQTTTPTTTAQPQSRWTVADFWLVFGDPQAAAWSREGEQGGQSK